MDIELSKEALRGFRLCVSPRTRRVETFELPSYIYEILSLGELGFEGGLRKIEVVSKIIEDYRCLAGNADEGEIMADGIAKATKMIGTVTPTERLATTMLLAQAAKTGPSSKYALDTAMMLTYCEDLLPAGLARSYRKGWHQAARAVPPTSSETSEPSPFEDAPPASPPPVLPLVTQLTGHRLVKIANLFEEQIKARSRTTKAGKDEVPWTLCPSAGTAVQPSIPDALRPQQARRFEQLKARPVRMLPMTKRRHLKVIDELEAAFPNFAPALAVIRQDLRLKLHCKEAVQLPPMLLLGEPGIGKTEFCKRLAEALGLHAEFRSLAEVSAGFVLIGSNSQWGKARTGAVAELVLDCPDGTAPLLVLDELDKVRSDPRGWPVDSVLLGFLESTTARAFRDEFLDVELDVRPMSVLLTANRMDGIRPELLSRLRMIEIEPPTREQMPAVIRSLDRAIRAENPAFKKLFHPLGDDVIGRLSARSPRELRRLLLDGYAVALEAEKVKGRRFMTPAHLGLRDARGSRTPVSVLSLLVVPGGPQWFQ